MVNKPHTQITRYDIVMKNKQYSIKKKKIMVMMMNILILMILRTQ